MYMLTFCVLTVEITFTSDSYQFSEDVGIGHVVVSKSGETFSAFTVTVVGGKQHSSLKLLCKATLTLRATCIDVYILEPV